MLPATLRLEQTSAGGFTAQTWDIAGNEANFFVRDVTGGSRLPFRIRPGAPTSSLDIAASGGVGIGTASPEAKLSAVGQINNIVLSLQARTDVSNTGSYAKFYTSNPNFWWEIWNADAASGSATNDLRFRAHQSAPSVELFTILGASGNVGIGTPTPLGKLDVNGTIFQRGAVLHADYVFEPTYNLESIEDHSAFMWSNKHLPAVGAKQVDEQGREVVEIGARMRGMLEEIEKAHIYISTLSDKITEKDAALANLERQIAELAERLARIEAVLSALKGEKK